jgi:hypothetical protein
MTETESVADLKTLVQRRDAAREAVAAGRRVVAAFKNARLALTAAIKAEKIASAAVEEVLGEIASGTSRYPILDHANGTPAPADRDDGPESEPPVDEHTRLARELYRKGILGDGKSFDDSPVDERGLTELPTVVDADLAAELADRAQELAKQKRRERDAKYRERKRAAETHAAGSSAEERVDGPAAGVSVDDVNVLMRRAAELDLEANEPAVDAFVEEFADVGPVKGEIDGNDESQDVNSALKHAFVRHPTNVQHMNILARQGASDEDIRVALDQCWGRQLNKCPAFQDRPGYTTRGGSSPALFLGTESVARRSPVLAGIKLLDRVRILFAIPQPKTAPPIDPATAGETDAERKRRAAAFEEYAPDGLHRSPTTADVGQRLRRMAQDVGGEAGKILAKHAEKDDPGGLPPWTIDDLDVELKHALESAQWFGDQNVWRRSTDWEKLRTAGASAQDIQRVLSLAWPDHVLTFVPPKDSHGKLGYTVRGGKEPAIWLGAFTGIKHKPTLSGSALLHRVREIEELPMPAEARQRNREEAKLSREAAKISREPSVVIPKTREAMAASTDGVPFAPMPEGGWDSASLANECDDMSIRVADALVCDRCHAMRARIHHPCPSCGERDFHLATGDQRAAALGVPEGRPKKRGPKPRKGIPGALKPE